MLQTGEKEFIFSLRILQFSCNFFFSKFQPPAARNAAADLFFSSGKPSVVRSRKELGSRLVSTIRLGLDTQHTGGIGRPVFLHCNLLFPKLRGGKLFIFGNQTITLFLLLNSFFFFFEKKVSAGSRKIFGHFSGRSIWGNWSK